MLHSRRLRRNRTLRLWFYCGSALGVATLGGTAGCNAILGNEDGQLAEGGGGSTGFTGSGGSKAGASQASAGSKANGGSTSSGGSTSNGGSKASGGSTSSGGSNGATGGKAGTGAAPPIGGAGGNAGLGTGGTAGAGGAGTVCAQPLLIDDLEDGDNAIAPCAGRVGYWFPYNDKGQALRGVVSQCSQTPAPELPFLPTAGGNASVYAAHTSGSGCTTFGAGLGFDFNNTPPAGSTVAVSKPYDGHTYTGFSVAVKGSVSSAGLLTILLTTPATTSQSEPGGTCVGTAGVQCDDHFHATLTPTATWLTYNVIFADTAHFFQAGFGTPATFDASKLIGMRFQVSPNTTFDVWIDDVKFF